MTTPLARLIEADTMLAYITTHYGTTLRRLNEAQPGFSARTPGSGEPGAGKGFTADSSTERMVIPQGDKARRYETRWSPEMSDLETALALPEFIAHTANQLATGAQLTLIDVPDGPRLPLRQLVWTRWLLHQLIAQNHPAPSRPLGALHRHCVELDAITRRWGGPLHTPKRQEDLIPNDPTERWCTSCLRIAKHSVRHRGDRCSWCYSFEQTPGNPTPPPIELLEKRHRGIRIYDRDIEPHRKAWRDKQKQRKRKKAG